MTTPAYYKDGIPYSADGQVIITITNGPPGTTGSVGTNPNNPFPVFVPWGPVRGGGSIAYDPNKVRLFGLYDLRQSQTAINQLLDKARNAYPQNAVQVRDEANALLAALRNSGLINNSEINSAANALQDAVNSLQMNIDLKNQEEQIVQGKERETDNAFKTFMNNNQLSNFIDKSAATIDFVISVGGPGNIDAWNKAVPPKINAEIEEKNKLVTYLDRVKTITDDVTAKRNALAVIKDRLEAEARRAEEARKAEAVRKALFAKAGVLDAPVYTPGMIKAANAAMATAGVMVLNRAGGMVQLSTWINSVMTSASELAGWVSGGVWRGAVEVSRVATLSAVAPAVGAFVVGFWPGKAGESQSDIDKLLGRDLTQMFTVPASLVAAGKTQIQPEMTTVDLPVRGFIRRGNNGQQEVILVKTGTGGVSATVPVYRPVRDEKTGLDRITLPAVAGAPGRTILINPGAAPSGPWHTGNPAPAAPVTPVHTGTEIKQADSIVTTTFPADDMPLQDFIYWQPDATGTGVEPVYVMLSRPYGETNAKGQYSGRDYNTGKAGGPIQNLDWKTATIDRAGVDKVKLHTQRFAESDANKVMINRLDKILRGEMQPTDTDKRFYTHEIRELERYRNLGIKDGIIPDNQGEVWNNTHTATLEDYKINERNEPLYTPEAINAAEEQAKREEL
ncbi:S-type pyocin domain-containing protein [Serratia marcescens]|uniref:S-type pyocin domain-containing protein n=1 Tax=Serratia marcescens TaxID=615 RepID=UPI00320761A7